MSDTAPPPGPAPESHHTLPVGTLVGGLEITGLVGEGGFGIVYKAYDATLQRTVALKEYMPSQLAARSPRGPEVTVKSARFQDTFEAGLRSFVNEARLLAHFDHPALVKVHQFWQGNRTAYMVMPYYQGPTLKEHVQAMALRGERPDEATLRAWIDPLLDALALMHAERCYHRDIAPDNILLTPRGPLLLDFGAARRVIHDMTHALTVILKPGYAPIEQYGDAATMVQGPWTDLYALASVVYYAITGRSPITSVERMMGDPLPLLATVAGDRYGARFLAAIDAALAVRPADRPQSADELRGLLDGTLPPRQAPPRGLPPTQAGVDIPVSALRTAAVGATVAPTHAMPRAAPTHAMPRAAPTHAMPRAADTGASASTVADTAMSPAQATAAPATATMSPPGASPRRAWAIAAVVVTLGLLIALVHVLQPRVAGTTATPGAAMNGDGETVPSARPETRGATGAAPTAVASPAPGSPPSPTPATNGTAVTGFGPLGGATASPAPRTLERGDTTAVRPVAVPNDGSARPPARTRTATPATDRATTNPAPPEAMPASTARVAQPSRPSRCQEILARGNQGTLSVEDATYLRQSCR